MKEPLVQRTLTLTIKGPESLVDDLALLAMARLPVDHDGVRCRVEARKDWLDDDWNVIPPEIIVEALRRHKEGD